MEKTRAIERHRTAIGRPSLSRPLRLAYESDLVKPGLTVFDYGCGRGDDLDHLKKLEIEAWGWDPTHRVCGQRYAANVVNFGYVANVIEDPTERTEALSYAWRKARNILIVAARLSIDTKLCSATQLADGCVTSRGTFQKLFTQAQLRDWIDQSLNVDSVAAAPGIFFIFRDDTARQSYLALRFRARRATPKKRKSDILYDLHRDLLDPLVQFVVDRGRLPRKGELEGLSEIESGFGSVAKAFAVVRRVTGRQQWDQIRDERMQELLLYFALARFSTRPRLGDLPTDLQLDVREFFASYKRACEEADGLLFSAGQENERELAMRRSEVGKVTPSALYIHVDALRDAPPVLRVYEGCARAFMGVVDDFNIIKLHRDRRGVSYLRYPAFDRDPHPALRDSMLIDLKELCVRCRSYDESTNPPILHRKDELVSQNDARWKKFRRFTEQEERWGLYEQPKSIGLRQGWLDILAKRGVELRGHRVVKTSLDR